MRGGSPVMQIRLRTPTRMRAQQLGLNTQNIAVAAAEVIHRFDAGLLLEQLAGHLGADARAGPRTVRDVDAIDAVFGAKFRASDFARRVQSARRQNFHHRDEVSGSKFRAELRFFSQRNRRSTSVSRRRSLPTTAATRLADSRAAAASGFRIESA